MADFKSVSISTLSTSYIASEAQKFREKYWSGRDSPIDIMSILEFDLKIRIIPSPGMESLCNSNCFITSDWKNIFIDKRQYEDERYDKRTNFSVAHEVAHYILHKTFWESLQIREIEDYYRFFEDCPIECYDRLENQANAFAARVLVPKEELISELRKIAPKGIVPKGAEAYLENKFNVSGDVIRRRILYEKIKINTDNNPDPI